MANNGNEIRRLAGQLPKTIPGGKRMGEIVGQLEPLSKVMQTAAGHRLGGALHAAESRGNQVDKAMRALIGSGTSGNSDQIEELIAFTAARLQYEKEDAQILRNRLMGLSFPTPPTTLPVHKPLEQNNRQAGQAVKSAYSPEEQAQMKTLYDRYAAEDEEKRLEESLEESLRGLEEELRENPNAFNLTKEESASLKEWLAETDAETYLESIPEDDKEMLNKWMAEALPDSAEIPSEIRSQTYDMKDKVKSLREPAAGSINKAKPGETDEEFAARLQESEDRGNQPK